MPKKIIIMISLIIILFSFFLYRVYDLAHNKRAYYLKQAQNINEIYVEGSSAPRGRILDINGNVLVDNVGINTIFYHKTNETNLEMELFIAEELAKLTNFEYKYNENKLKEFYLIKYSDKANKLITKEEYELYSERKLSSAQLEELKLKRITKNMLDSLTPLEKYSSYFYFLMNDGYSFLNKCLLTDVTDTIYASILESNLPGIFGEIQWERNYVYGETLKSVLGAISNSLPKEKEYLLKEGYTLVDKVGISGLEEYYEEYLKGEKAQYQVNNDNTLELVKPSKRGNDLILNIDINIQLEVEKIIKEEMINAKKSVNTEFYKESFALVSNPLTGDILAIAGIRLITNGKDYSFQDVSINVIKNAYTVGSAVKGASMAVGYQNKAIDIGTKMFDSCVKLANMPAKCSYKRLGLLNDIDALALSSNYYQFIIALKIMGYNYTYNLDALANINHFNTYRNTFASFGLGTETKIDLKNESIGLKGTTIAPDLLMNLAIGQYDLYTPIQLLQYINTIANNGDRLKLNIMHSIKDEDKVIKENKTEILNKIDLEEKYLKRIQEGFNKVMRSGTGYWYINPKINAAGKTGTSESYIDNNYDGILESYVLSNTFLMYAPYENPKYSVVVISPNTSNLNAKNTYRSPVNRLIARRINDFLFVS